MLLIHVMHRRALKSVRRFGLLAEYATGKRKAVWLCTRARKSWALRHLMDKFGSLANVVILTVKVSRDELTRYADGIYYCYDDLPPSRIVSAKGFKVDEVEV